MRRKLAARRLDSRMRGNERRIVWREHQQVTDMITLSILGQLDLAAVAHAPAAASNAVNPFVFRLSIFVLAVFVGYYVVWSVTPALHTPLMSVTNAISSVIVVGALLAVGVALVSNDDGPLWARVLGFVALSFASVNIFGGFLVTQRMLGMFQRRQR
jgi:H+-translocating NAD(P) transhydrogenase subunit alpha